MGPGRRVPAWSDRPLVATWVGRLWPGPARNMVPCWLRSPVRLPGPRRGSGTRGPQIPQCRLAWPLHKDDTHKSRRTILGGFATSADPVKDLPGTSGEAFWEVRQSPGELSQGAPGRGGAELSGGVPGSSPWDLGGGGLGAPGESQGEFKMEPKWSQNGISKWSLKMESPTILKSWISIQS